MAQRYNRIDPVTHAIETGKMSFTYKPGAENIQVTAFLEQDGKFHVDPHYFIGNESTGNNAITPDQWQRMMNDLHSEGFVVKGNGGYYTITPPSATTFTPTSATELIPGAGGGLTQTELIPPNPSLLSAGELGLASGLIATPRNHLEDPDENNPANPPSQPTPRPVPQPAPPTPPPAPPPPPSPELLQENIDFQGTLLQQATARWNLTPQDQANMQNAIGLLAHSPENLNRFFLSWYRTMFLRKENAAPASVQGLDFAQIQHILATGGPVP